MELLHGNNFNELDSFLFDDIMGFDFLTDSSLTGDDSSSEVHNSGDSVPSEGEENVDQAANTDLTLARKKRRKGPVSKYAKMKEPLKVAKPVNMSRSRTKSLVAFPTFDKCDSLVFFATTLARCLNTLDFAGLHKAVQLHFDKNCLVLYKGLPLDADMMIKRLQLNSELHPDMMMCARDTKVVGDTIEAKLFLKFTDIPSLYEPLTKQLRGTNEQDYLSVPRNTHLKTKLETNSTIPKSDRTRMARLVDSNEHLTIYATNHLTMRFNPRTHKVIALEMAFEFTAMELANLSMTELRGL